jgi:hypothetical protein
MSALTLLNVESELSYAYLHAVASKAGMSCRVGTRHEDNSGIDAILTSWGPFKGGGYLTEVDIKVQLKATIGVPSEDAAHMSYFLAGVSQYDDLRATTVDILRILVVLFLPKDPEEWLKHSQEKIELQKCAYWTSLRGAPETDNKSGQTVKIPKSQSFSVDAIRELAERLSKRDFPSYAE